MKIKTILGLAAISGFAYAHNKRGGDWTFSSLADTARGLLGQATGERQSTTDSKRTSSFGATSNVTPLASATTSDLH